MKIARLKTTAIAIWVLATVSLLVYAHAQAKTTSTPTAGFGGRYQLIPAVTSEGPSLYRLDTVTGDVWEYQATFFSKDSDGKSVTNPAIFIPVRSIPQAKWPQQ